MEGNDYLVQYTYFGCKLTEETALKILGLDERLRLKYILEKYVKLWIRLFMSRNGHPAP
jgi:hypothetical protein